MGVQLSVILTVSSWGRSRPAPILSRVDDP